MLITSVNNDRVKELVKLKDKKYRDRNGIFFVEGEDVVFEAYKNSLIKELYVLDGIDVDMKVPVTYVSVDVMKKISDMESISEYYAVCYKKKECNIGNRLVILDNIQDPGNMGTILRTADSLNMKQIIVSPGTADCYNSKVVRSTMGAIFRVNVIERDLEKVIKEMQKREIKIYATDLKTNKTIYDVDYEKSAVIIGNEANGVSKNVLELADERIKIPMPGKTESLNAAVATGVILYEINRKSL